MFLESLKRKEVEVENKIKRFEDGTIIIEDVHFFRASRDIAYFVAGISFEDVAKSYTYLKYDEEAQRRLKDGEPYLKDSQVKEFVKVLERGEDIIGNLVWNLRTENLDEKLFDYDMDNQTLKIHPDQNIFITDGYHRTKACNIIYEEGNIAPAKFSNYIVQIHFLDEAKEKDRFGKINHNTNQLSHSKRKRVLNDCRSEFIRELIDNTFLKGKIEVDIDNLSMDKLYTFNQLYNSIFGQKGVFRKYNVENENYYNDLLNVLINFFNYLPKVRKEFTFQNEDEKKYYLNKNLILEPIMLYAYMTVAKEMMKGSNLQLIDEFFELKLTCRGKNVWFFSKNSALWVGKILYDNGNSISGYPPQTCLIDTTTNAIKMIQH